MKLTTLLLLIAAGMCCVSLLILFILFRRDMRMEEEKHMPYCALLEGPCRHPDIRCCDGCELNNTVCEKGGNGDANA